MQPLLRSTVHVPYQSTSQRMNQKEVDIYKEQYTNLKKVDSKEHRVSN